MISDSAVPYSEPAGQTKLLNISEEQLDGMLDEALAKLALDLGVLPVTPTLPERAALLRALLSAASSVG
jgi:hypothetical protein